MKDEIKEILDYFRKYMSIDDCIRLSKIEDHITNLQQRCEYLERSNNRREDEIMSLRDECVDGETYKSRNEKTIEYIKDRLEEGCLDKLNYYDLHKIENILQGEDKDE